MSFEVVTNGFAQAGPKSVLMGAAAGVGMPLQYERTCSSVDSVHCKAISMRSSPSFAQCERSIVNWACRTLLQNFAEIVDDSLLVMKRILLAVRFVDKIDFDASMQEAGSLQALPDRFSIELGLRKDRRIGVKVIVVPEPRTLAVAF